MKSRNTAAKREQVLAELSFQIKATDLLSRLYVAQVGLAQAMQEYQQATTAGDEGKAFGHIFDGLFAQPLATQPENGEAAP